MKDDSKGYSLNVDSLSLSFSQPDGWLRIIQDLNLLLLPGKTVGLVGESGCGKSLTALSILRLLPVHAAYGIHSKIQLKDCDILNIELQQMRQIRGRRIAMIFQEPMVALSPVRTMYNHLVDVINAHQIMSKSQREVYIKQLMEDVELGGMQQKIHEYPHQWSGGQKQRFLIAMALASHPEVLLADEPTTALDLVIQKQILLLLKKVQKQYGLALLLISHDFTVVKAMADHIVVMYAGQVIENSPKEEFWERPLHPYVHQLINSVPNIAKRGEMLSVISGQVPNFYDLPSGCRFHPRCLFALEKCQTQTPAWHRVSDHHQVRCHLYPRGLPLELVSHEGSSEKPKQFLNEMILEVKNLFVKKDATNYILKDISFSLFQGRTIAIVGESGSGKTTLAQTLVGLLPYEEGKIIFSPNLNKNEIQLVFQDPASAMNPRWTIEQILQEGQSYKDINQIFSILDAVHMPKTCLRHYPHELSGGQRQRLAIARALLSNPKLLICDEPTSALDISVQAQILNLLKSLQREMGLTYVLITHDLDVVGYMADDMVILKDGELVEQGQVLDLWYHSKHIYTKTLIDSCHFKEFSSH